MRLVFSRNRISSYSPSWSFLLSDTHNFIGRVEIKSSQSYSKRMQSSSASANTDASDRKSHVERSTRTSEPAKPRLSASILLLNPKNEILMIQRTKESRTFSGMHAFPGGNHDPLQDGGDIRMTAIRELFEETGILLASPDTTISQTAPGSPLSPDKLTVFRRAIHSRTDPLTFPAFLKENNLSVQKAVTALIPFSQWVTPTTAKSRYWTWFYVTCLEEFPDALVAGDASGKAVKSIVSSNLRPTDELTPVPTHDGHLEIFAAYFQSPRLVLDSFNRGKISLMPPQFYLMTQLDRIFNLHVDRSTKGASTLPKDTMAERIKRIVSKSSFGSRTFNPRHGGQVILEDGIVKTVLMYEGDKDYEHGRIREAQAGENKHAEKDAGGNGAGNGMRHRSFVTFKEGVPASIELLYDVDVLSLDNPDTQSSIRNARL